jgi:hypothetical protein
MDYSEEIPFNRATLEPFCCIYYVDETSATWLHGLERLRGFPNQLNGIHQNVLIHNEYRKCWPPSYP